MPFKSVTPHHSTVTQNTRGDRTCSMWPSSMVLCGTTVKTTISSALRIAPPDYPRPPDCSVISPIESVVTVDLKTPFNLKTRPKYEVFAVWRSMSFVFIDIIIHLAIEWAKGGTGTPFPDSLYYIILVVMQSILVSLSLSLSLDRNHFRWPYSIRCRVPVCGTMVLFFLFLSIFIAFAWSARKKNSTKLFYNGKQCGFGWMAIWNSLKCMNLRGFIRCWHLGCCLVRCWPFFFLYFVFLYFYILLLCELCATEWRLLIRLDVFLTWFWSWKVVMVDGLTFLFDAQSKWFKWIRLFFLFRYFFYWRRCVGHRVITEIELCFLEYIIPIHVRIVHEVFHRKTELLNKM